MQSFVWSTVLEIFRDVNHHSARKKQTASDLQTRVVSSVEVLYAYETYEQHFLLLPLVVIIIIVFFLIRTLLEPSKMYHGDR